MMHSYQGEIGGRQAKMRLIDLSSPISLYFY